MKLLFEDGLGLDGLKLGLEVLGGKGARVGAAAGVVDVVRVVLELVTFLSPRGVSESVIVSNIGDCDVVEESECSEVVEWRGCGVNRRTPSWR